jgi:hypothetical protein
MNCYLLVKRAFYGGILLLYASVCLSDQRTLNEVRASITGPQETVLIVTLDIRRGLSGEERTLRDIVLEELMLLDAQKLGIQVNKEEVDTHINQLQKTYGHTRSQLEALFQSLGFTNEEGYEQLRRKKVIEKILGYRLSMGKRDVVTAEDVEAYWREHGPVEEATYTLATVFMESTRDLEAMQAWLATQEGGAALEHALNPDKAFTLKDSELSPERRLMVDKAIGTIIAVEPAKHGFEVTKLTAKTASRATPLASGDAKEDKKRYAEIEQIIRQRRFKEVYESYQRSLLTGTTIHFRYEADRKAVMGELSLPS